MNPSDESAAPAALDITQVGTGTYAPIGTFSVRARHNPRLQSLVERINAHEELWQLWRCANVNAVDRLAMSDHGEVAIRDVANAALRLLRLLVEAGHMPGVVANHGLTPADAVLCQVLIQRRFDRNRATTDNDP